MRDSATRCPHSRSLDLNIPRTTRDEKLEFVEHILGVLIESRFGPGRGYTPLTERDEWPPSFKCISADELEERLDLLADQVPFYLREKHLRKRVAMRTGQVAAISGNGASFVSLRRDGPTLKPPAHAGGSPSARGSPNTSGTFFFASSFASLASFA